MKIICIVGQSGVGKTHLTTELCKSPRFNMIESYTTRKKRTHNEKGHVFTTAHRLEVAHLPFSEQAKVLAERSVAYLTIGTHHYFALEKQFEHDKINLYVVDEKGAQDTKDYFEGIANVEIWHLSATTKQAIKQMISRGDTPEEIESRLEWEMLRGKLQADFTALSYKTAYYGIKYPWLRPLLRLSGKLKMEGK